MNKKKNVKIPKEEVVNVRMTTQQKTLLETVAAREGLGVSTWLLHEGASCGAGATGTWEGGVSVYFAQRKAGGLIKIGWSRSVKLRLGSVRAKMIGAIPGGRSEEKVIHKRFARLRVRGEWFRPSRELTMYIQNMAQDHEPDSETATTMVRLPKLWFKRLDKLAEGRSQPGMRVTRSKMIRQVIYLGMAELENGNKKR